MTRKKSQTRAGRLVGASIVLNGQRHHFDDIVPLYGFDFCADLLVKWERAYVHANPITTYKRTIALRRFLKWLAAEALDSSEIATVFTAIRSGNGGTFSKSKFREIVAHYAEKVRDVEDADIVSSRNIMTRRGVIESTSRVVQELADQGMWPNIGPIKGINIGRLDGGTTPSLGELSNLKQTQSLGVDVNGSAIKKSYETVLDLNRVRLNTLRELMCQELSAAYRVFREGQRLLREKTIIDLKQFDRMLVDEHHAIPAVLRSWLYPKSVPPKEGLVLLLQWLKECCGGSVFVSKLPWRAQAMIASYGGLNKLLMYLEGRHGALLPAYTIVLIDTGFNVQTCDDLPKDPFVGDTKRGCLTIATIAARKNRSAGQVVEAALVKGVAELKVKDPDRITAVEAIRMWEEMSGPLRHRSRLQGNDISTYLWVIRQGNSSGFEIIRYHAFAFKHWWSEFLKRHEANPVIGGLAIQRKMIRPTVLQLRAASNNFKHEIPQALANHKGASTTFRYLSAPWFRERLNEEIRRFQNILEAAIFTEIQDAPKLLKIAPDEFSARRELAAETGLGFICDQGQTSKNLNKLASSQTNCLELDRCANCSFRRFVPTEKSIKELLLMNVSLRAQSEKFLNANPGRWNAVWLPYLALTEAIIQKLKEGAKRALVRRLDQEVNNELSQGLLKEVQLW